MTGRKFFQEEYAYAGESGGLFSYVRKLKNEKDIYLVKRFYDVWAEKFVDEFLATPENTPKDSLAFLEKQVMNLSNAGGNF